MTDTAEATQGLIDSEKKTIIEHDLEESAGYKIEVQFGPSRTPNGPNTAVIQIWESGSRFDGGGDDKMYWCKDVRQDKTDGCWGPIPPGAMRSGVAYCPTCAAVIQTKYLTGERFVKLSTMALSSLVEVLFLALKSNADIYCKYHPTDMRYIATRDSQGLEDARRLRGLFIYPLKNILRDTISGTSIHNRFRAFLSA